MAKPNPSVPRREYLARSSQWERCRDVYEGSDAVKRAGQKYLPMLDSHERSATGIEYQAYKDRAFFYNAFGRTVDGFAGALFQRSPGLELPKMVEDHAQDLTLTGVPFEAFGLDAAKEVLKTGRVGVLVEMSGDSGEGMRPYWCAYRTEDILSWREERIAGDQTLTQVVLAETEEVVDPENPFVTKAVEQIRVLDLELSESSARRYQVTRWRKDKGNQWAPIDELPIIPVRRGVPLDYIPFAFIGPTSPEPCPEKPPLLDLADLNLSHYRNMADLEHGLHHVGVPQLILIGALIDDMGGKIEFGSSRAIPLPMGGDAKLLQANGELLGALERADERKRKLMATLGARLLEEQASTAETATAVSMRHAGEQASLRTIAQTLERELERCWLWHAWWAGVDAPEVSVEINKDFFATRMTPDEVRAEVQKFQAGAASFETMYFNLTRGGITRPGVTAEQEREAIQGEDLNSVNPGLEVEPGDEPAAGPGMMAGDVVAHMAALHANTRY